MIQCRGDSLTDGGNLFFGHRLGGAGDVDGLFEWHPAFATGIIQRVLNPHRLRELKRADDDDVERFLRPICKTHVEQRGVPEMKVGELVDFDPSGGNAGSSGHFEDFCDFAIAADFDFIRLGGGTTKLGAALRLRHLRILVDERGIEKKTFMLKLKLVVRLKDASLAQKNGLPTDEQIGDDKVPFLEGDGEGGHAGFLW